MSPARAPAVDFADSLTAAEVLEAVDTRTSEVAIRHGARSLNGHGRAFAVAEFSPPFRLLSDLELEQLPDPEWLLEGLIPARGFAVLYSAPGLGKTFLALDWSLSIASLPKWRGRKVGSGAVVYVAAEGVAGLKQRVAAWKQVNDREGQELGVYFLVDSLPVPDLGAVAAFSRAIATRLGADPRLIVLDTLARTMGGGDENATQDMGRFIAGVDFLRRVTGAAVLALHHSGWNETRERGNSSLRGAADTMMSLTPKDGSLVLEVTKQKDAQPTDKIRLRLHKVAQSCVLLGEEGITMPRTSLTANQRKLLEALRDTDTSDGIASAALERNSGIPKGSFDRTLRQCLEACWIKKDRRRHLLSASGLEMLGLGITKASEKHQ